MTDRVKLSFIIFDIWALWRSAVSVRVRWASECPDVKNYKWRLNLVWHRMLYTCTHTAIVGVKGVTGSRWPLTISINCLFTEFNALLDTIWFTLKVVFTANHLTDTDKQNSTGKYMCTLNIQLREANDTKYSKARPGKKRCAYSITLPSPHDWLLW